MVTDCYLLAQASSDAPELLWMRGDRPHTERTTTKYTDSKQVMAQRDEVSSCGCL